MTTTRVKNGNIPMTHGNSYKLEWNMTNTDINHLVLNKTTVK